jgi:hypothetical protein
VSEETKGRVQSPAESKLADFITNRYRELASDRLAEEQDWYLSGLYAGGTQWVKRGKMANGKSGIVPIEPSDKWSMPVTDHYSKTLAVNATALGAVLPRITAMSANYDARNRRAASYAEAAIDVANKESGLDVLNAILAIQVVQWGISVVKEVVAFDHSTEDVPLLAEQTPFGVDVQPGQTPSLSGDPSNPGSEQVDPKTGEPVDTGDPNVVGTERVMAPRLNAQLPTPFCCYIPRDCGDPNLAKETYERVSFDTSEARMMFPDYADELEDSPTTTIDDDSAGMANSLASFYLEQLRRMGVRNSASGQGDTKAQPSGRSKIYCVEGWVNWNVLPKETQDAIVKEWGDEPSEVENYQQQNMSRVDAAIAYGVWAIVWNGCLLQWGENPKKGDTPYTWFMWEKNATNPYGRGGLGNVLRPLQRQLNQLDALHDRSLRSNGTTKIMMPESQQYKTMSGDPVDIYQYDDMAGKTAPQLFPAGRAPEIPAKRAQIVQEFQSLGYTEGVSSGLAPEGTAFRAIAYLGAKAEEQRGTQRALWEGSHEILARKLLFDAKVVWTTPRKLKVAGPNNRYGAELLEGADLDFETDQLSIVEGSSRPKTLAEKEEAFNTLVAGGLVDVSDPDVRQFVYDTIGMPELSLAQSLQYDKAERDLQSVLDGMQPVSSPYQDFGIVLKIFSDYSLTEEYEGLPQETQAGILAYASWAQQMSAPPPPPMGLPPGADPQAAAAGQLPGKNPGKTLSKVPGGSATLANTEKAATAEGNQVASSVDNSTPAVAT